MTEAQASVLLQPVALLQQTVFQFQFVLLGIISAMVFAISWRA